MDMSVFNGFGKKKTGTEPKQRMLISKTKILSKKPVSSQSPSKVSSSPLTAIKTLLLPYREAVVDDLRSLLGLDNKSKQNRMDYDSFMNTHFKKEK
jgi:hypothetical protein